MGTPLLAGRTFRSDDGADRVLIDQTSAQLAFPDQNPIGRQVELSAIGSDPTFAEVIGVVAATHHHGVREDPVETLYFPMLPAANQQNFRYMAVRVAGDPAPYVESMDGKKNESRLRCSITTDQGLTDPVLGVVNLSYSAGLWSGSIVYAYPGCSYDNGTGTAITCPP